MPRRQRRRRLSGVSLNSSFNQDLSTPARQSSVEASEPEVSFIDLGENDDNAERSQVRKSRVRRKSVAGMITPVPSVRRGSRRSRRGSPSPYLSSGGGVHRSGIKKTAYTNDQLVQIYKDCIVKAQTGKINQQNAWNLHLVDNIKEITDLNTTQHDKENADPNRNNRNDRGYSTDLTMNNAFARASHTIDAASKIYGYRVDSVHNKTYKVLGSIHQQNADGDHGDIDGLNDDLNAEQKRKRQQRNRNVGRSTLCEQDKLYKLKETMKNLCVEVDPLFHKTASCFDEGGAKGLLMNTLYVQNGCDIVFDSNTKIEQNEDITNEGVKIDNDLIVNQEEIEKENQWMTQLFTQTFAKEVDIDGDDNAFDGFTQIDTTSPDFDVSTQTKPQNFVIDMEWIEKTSVCPLLNIFENNITNISKQIPTDWNLNESQNTAASQSHISPEKDLNNAAAEQHMFDDGGFGDDDDDVLMNMPDFTIGADHDLNAQDLFHEELLTQAVAPQNQQQSLLILPNNNDMNNVSIQNLSNLQLDPNNINNVEYVLGQNGQSIIGNIGVQQALNSSMTDNQLIVNNLQLEQLNENGQYTQLHQSGIYKRGAMNLTAMNEVISKLENADFESLTSFFDTKKHGNWAGPDQWYHRRYQLTLQQSNKNNPRRSPSRSRSNLQSTSPDNPENDNKPKKQRRSEKKTAFDFLSIANGNLIDEKEFEEPQRSFNTLTQAVLDKNRKTYHTLPKDLQIKPDMFIKLFHRPNYSVWRHWLRQHQLRMIKKREDMMMQQQQGMDANGNEQPMMGGFAEAMGLADDAVNMSMMNGGGAVPEPIMQQQAAAMAVIDGGDNDDFENEFQYNYDNPLDSSHFVPDMNGGQDSGNYFDFNLNGYDMVEDPNRKLDKIKVDFATSAKKVNVRKLKMKLWEKIDDDLEILNVPEKEKEDDEDEDIDMTNKENMDDDKQDKMVTFQDTLDTLPITISSSISVHMCFICLLHLANEKELQFVPQVNDENVLERGDFQIEYANENSEFEKEAMKINPVAVLGMM